MKTKQRASPIEWLGPETGDTIPAVFHGEDKLIPLVWHRLIGKHYACPLCVFNNKLIKYRYCDGKLCHHPPGKKNYSIGYFEEAEDLLE